MVTSVRVREALDTIGGVVTNLVLAIRGASAITLIRPCWCSAARSPPAIATGSMMPSF